MELIRVISGSLECDINDRKFMVYAGQAIIICPCRPHGAFAGADGAEYVTVMFDPAYFCNASKASSQFINGIISSQIQFETHTGESEVIEALDSIIRLDSSNDGEAAIEAVGEVYRLIAALCRYCRIKDPVPYSTDSRFREIFDYINIHFTEPLTVSGLSLQFGYNEAYFCRRFKELAGISAIKYIRILRLEYSKKLLKKQLPINETATLCGFYSISRFSSCFRRHFGISPTEYRQKH